jgi:tRNA (mo5U34)-methyltransferase
LASPFLKSLAMKVPAIKAHEKRLAEERQQLERQVETLTAERDKWAREAQRLAERMSVYARPAGTDPTQEWAKTKQKNKEWYDLFQEGSTTARLGLHLTPSANNLEQSVKDWVLTRMAAEPYWFHKIEVFPGVHTPGWSDPKVDKLPYYGLPDDLTGKRVLDIGCAEGFFSFEAEKRGAREVIGIDSFPDSVRRFNIVKAARQSNATAFLMNVYDLEPKRLGTFDLVLFYGVFYHLKHPQLALERIRSVCTGQMLFQTHVDEDPAVRGLPWAHFNPYGIMSGTNKDVYDPTVFWLFNTSCCLAMLEHVGFLESKVISPDPQPFVVSTRSPDQRPGVPPNQSEAPWS